MKRFKAYSGNMYYGIILADSAAEALGEARKQEASVDRVVLSKADKAKEPDPAPIRPEWFVAQAAPLSSGDTIADYLTKAGMRIVWAAKHVDALIRSPDKTFGDDEKRAVEAAIEDLEYARSQLISLRKHALNMYAARLDAITADKVCEIVAPG